MAWPLLACSNRFIQIMNNTKSSHRSRFLERIFFSVICLWPSLLMAHPGHYHPDETDEFDFLSAYFFHSHGAFDYLIFAVLISSLVMVFFNSKLAVRIAAIVATLGSVSLLSLF